MVGLNGRGQVFFYTFMLAIVVIVLAVAFAFPIKQTADEAMNASTVNSVGLDCSNSSITNAQKGQCILVDLTTPYFVIGLIAIAGIILGARVMSG